MIPALWHVVVQHFVGLDKVFLHGRHLGHDLLAVEFGRLSLPLPFRLLLVLDVLGQVETEGEKLQLPWTLTLG